MTLRTVSRAIDRHCIGRDIVCPDGLVTWPPQRNPTSTKGKDASTLGSVSSNTRLVVSLYHKRLRSDGLTLGVRHSSVVNKDLSFKAKAKDLTSEHVQGPLLIKGCERT